MMCNEQAKKVIERFAELQANGTHICPRCGRFSVKERLTTNAMSRYIHVYICDRCGTDEAVREMMDKPLPLVEWAIAGNLKGGDCCE